VRKRDREEEESKNLVVFGRTIFTSTKNDKWKMMRGEKLKFRNPL
jgi:hypothetical protein